MQVGELIEILKKVDYTKSIMIEIDDEKSYVETYCNLPNEFVLSSLELPQLLHAELKDNMNGKKLKVLNLYAGIGGNRKLWTNVDVTAVEYNPTENLVWIMKRDYMKHAELKLGNIQDVRYELYENIRYTKS